MPNKTHNETTAVIVPEGVEIAGNISFARLGMRGSRNPEDSAGFICARSNEPVLCGWISGEAHDIQPGEYQGRAYIRVVGNWFAMPWDRSREIEGTEAFFPPIIERLIAGNLKNGVIWQGALEGWAYPDVTAARGYVYRVRYRQAPGTISAAKRMAIEAGIIPAPEGYVVLAPPLGQAKLSAPTGDPEAENSGDPQFEENRVKDGLDKLLAPAAE